MVRRTRKILFSFGNHTSRSVGRDFLNQVGSSRFSGAHHGESGSSVRKMGSWVSSPERTSKDFNMEPPPVRRSRSTISAASSGACSPGDLDDLDHGVDGAFRASRTPVSLMTWSWGCRRESRLDLHVEGSGAGSGADLNLDLLSPFAHQRLYFFLMYCMIASSISFPRS